MMVDTNNDLEESAYDVGLRLDGDNGPLLDCELEAMAFAAARLGALHGYMMHTLQRCVPLAVAELRTSRALIAGFDDAASRWGDALGKEQTKNAALEKRVKELEATRDHALAESRVPRF